MDSINTRPTLLFLQQQCDERLPEFLLVHKREHVKCLSHFFNVIVLSEECDYQQICDKYEPDLVVFESGFPFASSKRLNITKTRAYPQIPKLGFLHSDAFCNGRAGFLSDMDHWGIEEFFTISVTAAEHNPEISNQLYVWPNFVDAAIFRDYGQFKTIPVLFTGRSDATYPWRKEISRLVSKDYPSLVCPHPGHSPRQRMTQVMVGEPYARMLNASWFAPTCGTVAKDIVRKHFEIPACKACLITEESPALRAAGFVDMENCVFADQSDISDKLAHLFGHPEELQSIINAGYELVQCQHTLQNRNQIHQWFELHKNLNAHQQIIQLGPFGPLRLVNRSMGLSNSHIMSNGLHLTLLRRGDEELWHGNYQEAERLYLTCASYIHWMPEPQLRLALCNLYKGDPKRALSWIVKPIQFTLLEYNAIDPDPVEWAYFIITLLCLGKLGIAAKRAEQFAWLHHPELDRIRWVTDALKGWGRTVSSLQEDQSKYRVSIHQLPNRNLPEWIRELCVMLRACCQSELANRAIACLAGGTPSAGSHLSREAGEKEERDLDESVVSSRDVLSGRNRAAGYFRRQLFYREVRHRVKVLIKYVLHGLEAKCGNFLPYDLSLRKHDEFIRAIQNLTGKEDIKFVLIIGAALRAAPTEAVLAGARQSNSRTSVFCVSVGHQFVRCQTILSKYPLVRWYSLSLSSAQDISEELENMVEQTQEENKVSSFDVLVIDGSELHVPFGVGTLRRELLQARFVFLNDLNSTYNHENCETLLRNPEYALVDHNLVVRGGHAIFEKQTSVSRDLDERLSVQLCRLTELS
jgi:hypothetical protein